MLSFLLSVTIMLRCFVQQNNMDFMFSEHDFYSSLL